jgi:hypothetical protein
MFLQFAGYFVCAEYSRLQIKRRFAGLAEGFDELFPGGLPYLLFPGSWPPLDCPLCGTTKGVVLF